jgi:hypothetical protein
MRKKAASDTMTAPELAARIRAAAASAGDILRPPDHRRIGSLAVGEKQRAARAEHRER